MSLPILFIPDMNDTHKQLIYSTFHLNEEFTTVLDLEPTTIT